MIQIRHNMWVTFRTYLLTDKKLSDKKKNIENCRYRFERIQQYFSDKDFTRENFNGFIYDLKQKGYKSSYINGFIKLAKHLDRFLKLDNLQDYTYFKEARNNYEILTPDEMRQLAEVDMKYSKYVWNKEYKEKRNKALIYLLATTGMRIGEVLTLEWTDVYESPWGTVAHIRTENAKNGEERHVPIPKKAALYVHDLPKLSKLVFNLEDDKNLTSDLQKRVERIGLKKKVWWHLFRHSYITHMRVDKEWDSQLLMKITGHKDPKSMFRYNQQDLRNMFIVQQSQDLEEETQTYEQVSSSLRKYIEKTVSKKRFKQLIEEVNGVLVIKIQKAYK